MTNEHLTDWDAMRRLLRVASLTPREQQVANFYAVSLPGAAFMNLGQVADAAGVSTASVTRFVRKLGFSTFRDLAASLRADARRGLERPGDRFAPRPAGDGVLAGRFERATEDLRQTAHTLDPAMIEQAIDLLSDARRPVTLAAVASGRPLLEHVRLLLLYLRGGVQVLAGTDTWPHDLAALDADAVLLVTAYDRDPLPLMALVTRARAVGATVIVVTNVAPSPLLATADVPLRIRTAEGNPFGSRVALIAVLETLVEGVAARLGTDRGRADAIETMFDALTIHPKAESTRLKG